MSTIATLRVPASEFVLDDTLSHHPSIEAQPLRSVHMDGGTLSPAIWIRSDTATSISSVLRDDPSVSNPERLFSAGDGVVYRVRLEPSTDVFMQLLADNRLSVLGAHGQEREWAFRVFSANREPLGSLVKRWNGTNLEHSVERISDCEGAPTPTRFGLTEPQYRALVAAFREGYYEVPRQSGITAVANILGISHQALSQRLRRGHNRLIQRTLIERPTPGFPL